MGQAKPEEGSFLEAGPSSRRGGGGASPKKGSKGILPKRRAPSASVPAPLSRVVSVLASLLEGYRGTSLIRNQPSLGTYSRPQRGAARVARPAVVGADGYRGYKGTSLIRKRPPRRRRGLCVQGLQGYLAHKKQRPSRTLQ